MIEVISKYHIKKKDQPFSLPNGETVAQTAIVTFETETAESITTLELGVIDPEYLYARIEKNQPIDLDRCYIENFSLVAFRKSRNLKANHFLDMNRFCLTNSVFDSAEDIDFSFVKFSQGELDLSSSYFLNGGIRFTHGKFGNGNFIFDQAYFHNGGINFANAHFGEGLLSFKNSMFNQPAKDHSTTKVESESSRVDGLEILNFEAASFGEGIIDFTRSNFGSGGIIFTNANFKNRDLYFVSTEFNTVRFTFKSVQFINGKLDFRFANFDRGDLIFDRTFFNDSTIDLSATEFKTGKISFNRTQFEKNNLIFESSEIDKGRVSFRNNSFDSGRINFNSAHYGFSDVIFDNVDFGKCTASFLRARIKTLAFKSCHLNAYFDLQLKQCKTIDLSNAVVRDIVDMKPYGFNPEIGLLNLSGLHLLGHLYIDWKTGRVKDLIFRQQTSHRNRSEQFRILKENYRSLGQYDAEDDAYVEFRRSEAKANLEDAMTDGSFMQKVEASVIHGFKWLIFDKIGLYATSPIRVLISMIFVYLFFVLIFFLLPFVVQGEIIPSLDHGEPVSALGKAFYHSVITFLTIGYGDYYPTGIFRWISGFEGFMGLFLISYFTVAFVRKVLR